MKSIEYKRKYFRLTPTHIRGSGYGKKIIHYEYEGIEGYAISLALVAPEKKKRARTILNSDGKPPRDQYRSS